MGQLNKFEELKMLNDRGFFVFDKK